MTLLIARIVCALTSRFVFTLSEACTNPICRLVWSEQETSGSVCHSRASSVNWLARAVWFNFISDFKSEVSILCDRDLLTEFVMATETCIVAVHDLCAHVVSGSLLHFILTSTAKNRKLLCSIGVSVGSICAKALSITLYTIQFVHLHSFCSEHPNKSTGAWIALATSYTRSFNMTFWLAVASFDWISLSICRWINKSNLLLALSVDRANRRNGASRRKCFLCLTLFTVIASRSHWPLLVMQNYTLLIRVTRSAQRA